MKHYNIGADRIPERKVCTYRLRCQTDRHDEAGLKAGRKLEQAETMLYNAAYAYMKAGGSKELALRWVFEAVEDFEKDKK